jgi:hypothetical protein
MMSRWDIKAFEVRNGIGIVSSGSACRGFETLFDWIVQEAHFLTRGAGALWRSGTSPTLPYPGLQKDARSRAIGLRYLANKRDTG